MKLKNLPILKASDINDHTVYRLRILGKYVIPEKILDHLYYLKTHWDGSKRLVNCRYEHSFTGNVPIASFGYYQDHRELQPYVYYNLTDENAALMTPLFDYNDVREVEDIAFKTTGDPEEYFLYPMTKRFIVPYGDHGDYEKVYVLKKTQPILTESLAIKRRISHLESEIKYEQGKLKTAKAKELEYIRRQEKGLEQ